MFQLDRIVPWGRSFEEYRQMFALTETDFKQSILGCADGPASFNAELTARGGNVTSFDPIYGYSAHEIRSRIDETSERMISQARENIGMFVWRDFFTDPDALAQHRLATMDCFLEDFESGHNLGRYVAAELPALPFADHSFQLALCSHFLFLYSEQLSERFHIDAIREMLRVANEVRIFPLTNLAAQRSQHVEPVSQTFEKSGLEVTIVTVEYEFQRGANQMMTISQ